MKFVIDCANYFASNSLNFGDIAILRTLRDRLHTRYPGSAAYCFTATPEVIRQHVPGLLPIKVTDRSYRDEGDAASEAIVRRVIGQADMVMLSGGGFFSDHFARHALRLLETLAMAQAEGIPTAVMSPGFEPITNERLIAIARQVLPRCDLIGCRDPGVSPRVLAQLGVPEDQINVTGDDAIMAAGAPEPCPPAGSLGFNLRKARYAGIDDGMAEALAGIVARASAELGAPVQVLPTNVSRPSDAADTCEALERVGFPCPEPAVASLDDLLAALTRCRVVITASFHVAALALAKGRPVAALARSAHYRQKLSGLADLFGPACRIVDLDGPFEPALTQTITTFWSEANSYETGLRQAVERQHALQEDFWDALAEILTAYGDRRSAAHRVGDQHGT
jgi:polysaccharide pyruvyl transferase WcaK-like protein